VWVRGWLKASLVVWLVAEVVALAAFVSWAGWPVTILLGVVSSALGMALVRRAGRDAMSALRSAARSGRPVGAPGREILRGAAGALLILPGFVSDLAALALLTPPVRDLVLRRFAPARKPGPRDVIDLDPEDWRRG
jgi:UPF0716 protein FxsA